MRYGMRAAGVGIIVLGLCGFAEGQQLLRWKTPGGGDIRNAANWDPSVEPTFRDSLLFDVPTTYGVTAPYGVVYRRGEIRSGRPRFLPAPGSTLIPILQFIEEEPANPPGLTIGARRGDEVVVDTSIALASPLMVVGDVGFTKVTARAGVFAESFVVGGTDFNADAFGEIRVVGANPLRGLLGGPADVTLGLAGFGRLALAAGAEATIGTLRMGIDPGSTGELRLGGAGTIATVERMEFGGGTTSLVVGRDATLRFADDYRFGDESFGPGALYITIDGGVLLAPAGLRAGWVNLATDPERSGFVVESGGRLIASDSASIPPLTVQGPGSRFGAPALAVQAGVTIRDGGLVDLGPRGPDGPPPNFFNPNLSGSVTIESGGRLHYADDRVPSADQFAWLLLGGTNGRTGGLHMADGGSIETEGLLDIRYNENSRIAGAETRIVVHVHAAGDEGAETAGYGTLWLTRTSSIWPVENRQVATLAIAEQASVLAPAIAIDGPLVVDDATLRADGPIAVQRYTTTVYATGRVEAADVVLTRRRPTTPTTGTLAGNGVVAGRLINGGRVAPSSVTGSTGTLTVDGDYVQARVPVDEPSFAHRFAFATSLNDWLPGRLHIDIASPADHDRLEINGVAELSSTVEIATVDGFTPSWGDRFVFLTASAIEGRFETPDSSAAPSGLFYEIDYTDTTATIVVHNHLDLTRDFRINAGDLAELLTEWGATGGNADLTRDGVVDGADLGVLLGAWGQAAN